MDSFIELDGPFGLAAALEKARLHNAAEPYLPRYPKMLSRNGFERQVNGVQEDVEARREGFKEEGE